MAPTGSHAGAAPSARNIALSCVLVLAACEARTQAVASGATAKAPQAPAPAQARSPAGIYAMAPPLVSELRVVALPGRAGEYRIEVHGGGDPGDGAGVAADCQAVAEGRLDGDRIDAAPVPFESDIGGLDASDLHAGSRLVLTLQGDAVQLDGRFEHCPMGTAMAGTYRRTTTTRLFEACAPLPAACWNRD